MRSKTKSRHDSRQFGLSYFSTLNPRNDDFEKIELEFHEFSQPTKSADEINNVLDEIASDLETKCVMENVVGDSVVVVIEDQKWKKFKREECLPKKSRNSEDISFALKKLVKLGFLSRQKKIRALKVSLMYSKSMEVKIEHKERFASPFFAKENIYAHKNRAKFHVERIEQPGINFKQVKPKSEKISNIPKKKQRGKKAKKEEKIQKTTILSLYKNYKFPAEIKEENSRQFPIPMDFEDSRSREQFVDLTNIPGTSEMNFFQRMNEDSNHSNKSIKFEPRKTPPKTPARNTTMNPKAAALVEEYRNIDENSMDAMLAQIIDDPKEREALLKFSAVKLKPLVNHSKQQTTKSTKKTTKGRPKKTPPKRGSVNQSTIAQMFKKAASKKS